MKALQLRSPGQVELIDMAVPAIHDDELLIRTGASAICTSDLNDIRDNPFHIPLPVVLGHEAAGTVAEMGAKVNGFKKGDPIAAHPVHPCGRCDSCRGGTPHLCDRMGHFGNNMQGTFAEYFVVRQDRARKIPVAMDFAVGALAEPVAVCLEALAQARLRPGDRLLIVGDGPFGILLARLAATKGLGRLVVAGHHDFRLSFAHPALTVNASKAPDGKKALLEAGDGLGYDAAILATGNRRAFHEALELLRPKGRAVVFSAMPGETPVDLFRLHVKELEIVGACNDQNRLDEAVEFLVARGRETENLITHRFPIEEHRKALALAQTGRETAMKVAFVF